MSAVIVTFNGDDLNYSLVDCGLRALILAAHALAEVTPDDINSFFPSEDIALLIERHGEGFAHADRALVWSSDDYTRQYGPVTGEDAIVAAAVLRARYEYDLRKPLMAQDMAEAQQRQAREALLRG